SAAPLIVDHRIQVTSFSISNNLDTGEFVSGQNRIPMRMGLTATVLSDPSHPAELWIGRGNILRRVTAHNETFRRSASLIEPEQFRSKSLDGAERQGWLMKRLGWREDRKYPMILSSHGGPRGVSGYAFNPTLRASAARASAI